MDRCTLGWRFLASVMRRRMADHDVDFLSSARDLAACGPRE